MAKAEADFFVIQFAFSHICDRPVNVLSRPQHLSSHGQSRGWTCFLYGSPCKREILTTTPFVLWPKQTLKRILVFTSWSVVYPNVWSPWLCDLPANVKSWSQRPSSYGQSRSWTFYDFLNIRRSLAISAFIVARGSGEKKMSGSKPHLTVVTVQTTHGCDWWQQKLKTLWRPQHETIPGNQRFHCGTGVRAKKHICQEACSIWLLQ